MTRASERLELAERVHAFIEDSLGARTPEAFEALALDIHAFQLRHDPVQRALAGPTPPRDWTHIPAVPVDLFKDLSVGTVPPSDPGVTFRTSGTTQARRGTHHLQDTRLYDHGADAWHRRRVPEAPPRVVALLQDPREAPDSSLSHMVQHFGEVTWWLSAQGLDLAGIRSALSEPSPVYVCATAFALAELLSSGPVPRLPEGSVVMVTGGFKGRITELSESELYTQLAQRLAPSRWVREYGMTELSSQLWATAHAPYQPPPWLRPLAVDPATGAPRAAGEPGQLRFIDLCNLDGAVAIETLDEGVVHPDGSLTLHGRLQGAAARGCSLTVEELHRGER